MDLDYNLLEKNENPKVAEFIQTYKLWQAYFERVYLTDTQNPVIQKLNANIRLMVICGCAENLSEDPKINKHNLHHKFVSVFKKNNKSDQAVQKYLNFFNKLSYAEKFYFNISYKLKRISPKADRFYKQLAETGNEKYLNKLLKIQQVSRKVESENNQKIFTDFINDHYEDIDKEFNKRVELLYGLRSVLAHTGKPMVIVGSGLQNLYMGIYETNFYSSLVAFENFFYIAIYRNLNLPLPEINTEIIKFLQGEPINRYPILVYKTIDKLKSAK